VPVGEVGELFWAKSLPERRVCTGGVVVYSVVRTRVDQSLTRHQFVELGPTIFSWNIVNSYHVGRNANTTADAVWKAYEKIQDGTVLGTWLLGSREARADIAAADVNGYSDMELETLCARSSMDRATDF
jgi:hypothetical protein